MTVRRPSDDVENGFEPKVSSSETNLGSPLLRLEWLWSVWVQGIVAAVLLLVALFTLDGELLVFSLLGIAGVFVVGCILKGLREIPRE
jgi:hypothetical protein